MIESNRIRGPYTISEIDIPDEWRIVPTFSEENTKVFRTSAIIIEFNDPTSVMAQNKVYIDSVVPVYSDDNKIIGCSTDVIVIGEKVYVDLIIDYSTPERLDIESGSPIFASPIVDYRITEGYDPHIIKRDYKIIKIFLSKEKKNDSDLPVGKV